METLYITLTNTFDNYVDEAIRIAKENKLPVIFKRDGVHGTDDLAVILKFQEAGFSYRIYGYKSEYDQKAIRVEFRYNERDGK